MLLISTPWLTAYGSRSLGVAFEFECSSQDGRIFRSPPERFSVDPLTQCPTQSMSYALPMATHKYLYTGSRDSLAA